MSDSLPRSTDRLASASPPTFSCSCSWGREGGRDSLPCIKSHPVLLGDKKLRSEHRGRFVRSRNFPARSPHTYIHTYIHLCRSTNVYPESLLQRNEPCGVCDSETTAENTQSDSIVATTRIMYFVQTRQSVREKE